MRLEEVARKARVSTATVSRVLNNNGVVKDATRKRVLAAVEELNYHPNLHARSLAGGRSRTLGVIVSNISNPFFSDLFIAVEAAAKERGFEVMLENTNYRPQALVSSVRSLLGHRVAGLALIVSEQDPDIDDDLRRSGLPIAFTDVGTRAQGFTNVRVRYEVGMRRIVDYLSGIGHRRMAFLGHHSRLGPLEERLKAFVEAVSVPKPRIEHQISLSTDTPQGGFEAAREVLSSGFRPTALVCVNDLMAIGALRAAHSLKLRVPEDLSITGFDNIEFSSFTAPPLTTCNVNRRRIADLLVESLLEESDHSGREFLIDPELILRDSTAPAASKT